MAAVEPRVEQLRLPSAYGKPKRTLAWQDVSERLERSPHYWLATVRTDGRPQVVPLDGIWLDASWYFGGSPEATKHKNLQRNPQAAMHLEDAKAAITVEGDCEVILPDQDLAERLAAATEAKYGYGGDPTLYTQREMWALRARRAVAWQDFPHDATRFTFGSS